MVGTKIVRESMVDNVAQCTHFPVGIFYTRFYCGFIIKNLLYIKITMKFRYTYQQYYCDLMGN